MVLAVSMIALLSCIAVWLIVESKSNMQTTKAYERTESTSRLAETACWVDVQTLDTETPPLPGNATLTVVTESWKAPAKTGNLGSGWNYSRDIRSAQDFYNTIPPEGWMLNEPSRYYTRYYVSHGTGSMPLSGSLGGTRGSARSKLVNFDEKIAR
jgi:hypothetical protein